MHRILLAGAVCGLLADSPRAERLRDPLPDPGPSEASAPERVPAGEGDREFLPVPVRVPHGKTDRFVELERSRVALGLIEGASPPEGTTRSPFPNVVFATADLGAAGDRWSTICATWRAHPSVDWVSPVGRDGFDGALVFPREVIVGFEVGAMSADAERQLLVTFGLRPEVGGGDWQGLPGVYRCRSVVDDAMVTLSALEQLSRRAEIRFAEPDAWFTGRSNASASRPVTESDLGSALPLDDPLLAQSWGLDNFGQSVGASPSGVAGIDVDALAAWQFSTGGANAPIAIIDVGVDLAHPDLSFTLPGTDVSGDLSSPGDGSAVNVFDSHGTAVAGCMLATMCNGLGSAGLASDAAATSIRAFMSVNASGAWAAQLSSTVNALSYAESLGVRVTVNSNAYGFTSTAIDLKYAQTRADGMVHVASAGNSGLPAVTYPASIPAVLAISGVDSSGSLASFGSGASNTGAAVVLTGPAKDVLTTDRSGLDGFAAGDFTIVDGTSFSAPFVAAVAALALDIEPDLDAAEVEAILFEHALDLGAPGRDNAFGFGLVQAAAVVIDVRSPEFDGTGDPIVLEVSNAPAPTVGGEGSWIHRASGGDTVQIHLADPLHLFSGDPFSIGFEFPSNGTFPAVLPGFWLGATAVIAPVGGPLPAGGFTISLPVPVGLPELRLLAQGVVLTTAGGFHIVTTPGLDLRIR